MIHRLPRGPSPWPSSSPLGLVIWMASGNVRQTRDAMEDPFEARSDQPARVEVGMREATPISRKSWFRANWSPGAQ